MDVFFELFEPPLEQRGTIPSHSNFVHHPDASVRLLGRWWEGLSERNVDFHSRQERLVRLIEHFRAIGKLALAILADSAIVLVGQVQDSQGREAEFGQELLHAAVPTAVQHLTRHPNSLRAFRRLTASPRPIPSLGEVAARAPILPGPEQVLRG